jgi:DNA polymerase III epsilon subunit-like protein
MYLFFDTETTGLPRNYKAALTDFSNWPRLVQLAYLVYDEQGTLQQQGNYIIIPDGFTIPKEAANIHGISTERAMREGKPIVEVFKQFESVMAQATCIVAHNMGFDEKILGSELLRNGLENCLATKSKICTMERTTNFCALRGPYGNKWPKLSELHYKLFNSNFEEAHNAAVDIEMTAKCFWELKRIGVL